MTGKRTAAVKAAVVLSIIGIAIGGCGSVDRPTGVEARVDVPSRPAVEVRVQLQPEHARQAGRYVEAARATLTAYAQRFGVMPITSLTIVDAVSTATATKGAVVAPTRWLAPGFAMEPEISVTRAVGERFWQQALSCGAGNWFVDGLSRYASTPVIASLFAVQQVPPAFAYDETRYFGGFIPRVAPIPLRNATVGNGLDDYRRNPAVDLRKHLVDARDRQRAVAKTALAMGTLERWVGAPTWDAVLEEFASRRWPQCPVPSDLEGVAQEVTGLDLSWFFPQVFDSAGIFDYGVESLTSTPAPDASTYRTTVIVRRYGGAQFTGAGAPRVGAFESGRGMELRLVFEDGGERIDHWDGRDSSREFVYDSTSPVQSATIDPAGVLLLDINRTNNSRMRAPAGPQAATKWTARWAVWLQDFLLTYASLT